MGLEGYGMMFQAEIMAHRRKKHRKDKWVRDLQVALNGWSWEWE